MNYYLSLAKIDNQIIINLLKCTLHELSPVIAFHDQYQLAAIHNAHTLYSFINRCNINIRN